MRDNPWALGTILRRGFVRLWKLRGGGFYGLGWVICFISLQIQSFTDDVVDAQGIGDFASNWLWEKLLTFGYETFMNFGLSFAWPGFLIERLGGWGIVLLVGGFVLIDGKLRPWVLAYFPELVAEEAEQQPESAGQTLESNSNQTTEPLERNTDERR